MKKPAGNGGWRLAAAPIAVIVIGMSAGCPGPEQKPPSHVIVVRQSPPPAVPLPPKPPVQAPAQPPVVPALPATLPPPRFAGPPMVRIWLSDVPAAPEISCPGPCRIQPLGGPAKRFARLAPAKAVVVSGGLRLGDEIYPKCAAVDLQPEAGAPIRVGNHPYPGAIRLLCAADRIAVIDALDLETYLRGVLGAEMPRDWPREALRAQAVVARTYALYYQLQRAAFEWDLTNTVEDQVYDGGNANGAIAEAVNATRGEVLLHDGGVFPAFFHSTCGGQTESPGKALGRPEYDFLEGVPCGFCKTSPHYKWSARIAAKELVSKLRVAGIAVGLVTDVIAVAGDGVSVERSVRLVWPGGEISAPIADFRRAVGRMTIQSGKFECRAEGDGFVFTGRGFGHGAGMCQYGCKGMAEAGRACREILAYYYRNTTLQKLY